MRIRRALFVLAIVALVFALAAPSYGAKKKGKKKKGEPPTEPPGAVTQTVEIEGTTWFWASQESVAPSDVAGTIGQAPCPPGAPVCPDQRVQLPNPHEIGALPIQVLEGQDEKLSGILFDLADLIPVQGAVIESFTFSVTESPDGRDRTQFVNASGQTVVACLIQDLWPPSEEGAEDLENAPPFDCTQSVPGTRKDNAPNPATWEFDITGLAQPWGEDPSAANGVMLVGQKEGTESWQIVLKGPRRDDLTTATVDEEATNQNNILASITFTPNPEDEITEDTEKKTKEKKSAPAPAPPSTSTGTTAPSAPVATSGDFGFGDTPAPPAAVEAAPTEEVAVTQAGAAEEPAPSLPGQVWILVPLGLLALSMVRSMVLEPAAGKRPDGVVAMIRERNAARRGTPPAPLATSPLAGVTRLLRAARTGLRSGARSLSVNVRNLTKRGGK